MIIGVCSEDGANGIAISLRIGFFQQGCGSLQLGSDDEVPLIARFPEHLPHLLPIIVEIFGEQWDDLRTHDIVELASCIAAHEICVANLMFPIEEIFNALV